MSNLMEESKPSPELFKARLVDPLQVGRYVKVLRSPKSGGKIEDGFKITAFINDGIVAVVQKEIGSEKVRIKNIPLKELEELNPPKQ